MTRPRSLMLFTLIHHCLDNCKLYVYTVASKKISTADILKHKHTHMRVVS